jgi:hypothetical protein
VEVQKMRGLLKPLLLLAVVLLVPISAYAQATGSIAGVVRDPSNAVIPGVTVEVSSPALIEKVRSTTTDSNGRYQITALPVGTYKITFALQGFNTVARENIVLNADFTAPVNVQLAVGNLTDVVTVVAETPQPKPISKMLPFDSVTTSAIDCMRGICHASIISSSERIFCVRSSKAI